MLAFGNAIFDKSVSMPNRRLSVFFVVSVYD